MAQDIPLDSLVPSQSKYLAKEDAGKEGLNLTIKGFSVERVGHGSDADDRCIMHFAEDVKPMVVNKTNMGRIKHFTGATTTGEARGKKINVYNDETVEYGGQMIGGLRIRAVTETDLPTEFDDAIPF